MHVILARLSTTKEIAAGNALLATMEVPCRLDGEDGRLTRLIGMSTREDVDDGLRGQSWYGGAAGVLQHQRHPVMRQNAPQSVGFFSIEISPCGIIRNHPHAS